MRSKGSGAERLADIWTARYNRSLAFVGAKSISTDAFEYAISAKGRRKTLERLSDRFIKQSCRRGAIRTSDLYVCYKDANLRETAALAKFSIQVYAVLLQFYKTHSPRLVHGADHNGGTGNSNSLVQMPDIILLVDELKPLLSDFHTQQTIGEHWQTRSFLSTQLSFTSWFLLETLTQEEQLLLGAYFYFLEEYVSMPWYGVYEAATTQELNSPQLNLVERMLPQIAAISMRVYTRWSQLFGGYYNRRGQLDNPGVRHSSLRDFSMFQVYLWLCVLQGNLDAVEQELLALCARVYRGIGIPWEMTVKGTSLLIDEIVSHLNSQEKALIQPYTDGMLRAFEEQK
ncbi:MAG: hypothetical protein AAF579_01615 [Cyanobacteria bacterium P01_C01_bin.118]